MAGSISWKRTGGAIAVHPDRPDRPRRAGARAGDAVVAMFVTVIVSERVAYLRRAARGEPTPMERLDAQAAMQEADG